MKLSDNPRAYAIMGCAMRVHKTLGPGFLESAYGDALEIEFARAGIPYVREDEVRVVYDGHLLKTTYRADFTCFDRSYIVELKAIRSLSKIEWAQVIHYMRATKIRFALLVNFGRSQLQYETFDLERLSTVSEQEINSDLSEPSRGPLRPLRGSAFGLGQPDAFGAGASTLRLFGGLGAMPPGKEKRSVSGDSDTSEFTKQESQSVEGECLLRSPDHSAERECTEAKRRVDSAKPNPQGAQASAREPYGSEFTLHKHSGKRNFRSPCDERELHTDDDPTASKYECPPT